MNRVSASVLMTVNVPYKLQMDGPALARCLVDFEQAREHPGHVSGFFGEVPLAHQLEFAAVHRIPVDRLRTLASRFAAWSGEDYPLVTENA